jgi:hypothetical protein
MTDKSETTPESAALQAASLTMSRLEQERDAALKVAEAGYQYLAYTLQSHMFNQPSRPFDMSVFAPEAREFCNRSEQLLYDACAELARRWR